MKRILTIVLLIASIVAANAQIKKYSLKIGDFKEFTVACNMDVTYKYNPDSVGYARFICEPEVAHALTFSNRSGKLKIEIKSDNPIDLAGRVPQVIVYSSQLNKATNLGDSTVYVIAPAPCESLTAKVIGNGFMVVDSVHVSRLSVAVEAGRGAISVSGRAHEAKYEIASIGSIDALDVESVKTKCWMLGTGEIFCTVGDEFTVYGAGSGSINYIGEPKKIKKHSLGVKLNKIEPDFRL